MLDKIKEQTAACLEALLAAAELEAGDILVVGCSTSEIMGKKIGSEPVEEAGEAVFEAIRPLLEAKGIWLAAQCCEHLNRALVMEKEAALRFGLTPVTVVPVRKAGGSWAAWAYRHLKQPVVVENLDNHKAAAGIDIGETCIGMHLRPVAVMVRPAEPWIGEARVTMVRTRPKLIGGERAQYK
ncbi:MAG: TIGR01440 family protein [Clostridiales bacterium]